MIEEFTMDHEETVKKWNEKIKEIISLYNINKNNSLLETNNENHKIIHDIIEYQNNDDKEKTYILVKHLALNCLLQKLNEAHLDQKNIDLIIDKNRELMINKNKNYGSSWSIMRPIGITDIIHVKIHRIESLISGEKNNFESINDNLEDILNYCIFLLIMLQRKK